MKPSFNWLNWVLLCWVYCAGDCLFILLKMQHLLLRLSMRNNWNLLISSISCNKCDCYTKNSGFSTWTRGQNLGKMRLSEVEIVAKKIGVGRSEDEILSSLMNDEVCLKISASHGFVGTLLCRFRDDWKAAIGVFRWAETRPNYEHLPACYDLMVDILGKARQFSRMEMLVDEMRERNLVSLNTVAKIMRRFAGARKWKDAVRIFDDLNSFGLEKNTVSMNLLFDTLCKENRVEVARESFIKLKSHIPPSLHTFTIFIHGWCKVNRIEEAYWTLEEMKGYGFSPCVVSYSIIIKSFCLLHNWSKVYELLDLMKAQGCQPSVVTCTTIMSSLTKAGDFESALKMRDMVKSSGYKTDTTFYNALIHTLGKAQQVKEAYDVFKVEMPKNGVTPNTETYNTLISMYCYHGEEQMAFNILEDMENTVCKPDLQTFDPLLKLCLKLPMIDDRLSELLDDMISKHHLSLDVSTYTLLIHGLCRVDKCEWAFQIFEEMINKELILRFQTCRLLLEELEKKELNVAADRVWDYMNCLRESKQKFPDEPAGSKFILWRDQCTI